MNYLTSVRTIPAVTNTVMLVVRIFIAISMILLHGVPKIEKYLAGGDIQFLNFLGMGSAASLVLAIIVEIGCSILILLGLFTRPVALILIFTMLVAAFGAHFSDGFKVMEISLLYLVIYALIWAFGPRDYSVDAMISKKRESSW